MMHQAIRDQYLPVNVEIIVFSFSIAFNIIYRNFRVDRLHRYVAGYLSYQNPTCILKFTGSCQISKVFTYGSCFVYFLHPSPGFPVFMKFVQHLVMRSESAASADTSGLQQRL